MCRWNNSLRGRVSVKYHANGKAYLLLFKNMTTSTLWGWVSFRLARNSQASDRAWRTSQPSPATQKAARGAFSWGIPRAQVSTAPWACDSRLLNGNSTTYQLCGLQCLLWASVSFSVKWDYCCCEDSIN